MQTQQLDRVAEALSEMVEMLKEFNDAHCDSTGYLRAVSQNESMQTVMAEAHANGSIVATKGEAVVIMPKLVDGWRQIYGGRRTDLLNSVREHTEKDNQRR